MIARRRIHFVVSEWNLLVERQCFVEQEKGEWTFRPSERFFRSFFFGWKEKWVRKETDVRVFMHSKEKKGMSQK
jgi:hypothetical protein